MRGLTQQVAAILDRRLSPASTAPLAVALSGGGDSTALTLIAHDWARRHGRRLLILTVDHRLSPHSGDWTRACGVLAQRLGADFQALAWTGEKPARGLPAAARAARHALLADAARAAGASVIAMGHTADDLAEAAAMRATGSTTPDPREWAPSPAWPEGRGVFILRPMLGVARADLRAFLAERGESWIEDPANADPRFARSRARVALAGAPTCPAPTAPDPDLTALAQAVRFDGSLVLPREALRQAAPDAARAFTGIAALCAAGTTRPPRRERLQRLAQALCGDGPVVATLAGATITADTREVRWLREAGEIARNGQPVQEVRPGEPAVWDGRYEIVADRPLTVAPLAGRFRQLSPAARSALQALPPRARGALPAFEMDERIVCPVLEPVHSATATPLVLARVYASGGLTTREEVASS